MLGLVIMMKNRKIGNITKIKDGKYKIRISAGFDDFGKRKVISKTVSASSDREAEKILMHLYNDKDLILSSYNTDTLGGLIDNFFKNHVSNLALNTQEYYKLINNKLKNFHKLKSDKIDISNINKILSDLNEGKEKQSVFKFLKTVINKNIAWGYFKNNNPCNFINTPKYKPEEKKILSSEDILTINNSLIYEPLKYQCIFYFACLLGMRRQEILALKWNDVNFNNKTVSISKALTLSHGRSEKKCLIKSTKTEQSERVLFLPDFFIELLKRYKKEQNIEILKLGSLYNNQHFIFSQLNGDVMNLHTPTNWWRKFVKKNNLNHVTFHGLRHSCCSLMLNNNVDISTISKTLGHANVSTTLNIYSHMLEDSKKNAINSVANVFNVAK